jgi:predicted metal-dependent enzyme (double-stranded beta helix superfamily)
MGHTLEGFAAACHRILTEYTGREGREQVCRLLQDVLVDEPFVSTYLTDDGPERKILYQDPQLGFCILAHVYAGAKESAPHDHGPSWAIYGQARGETVMSDWSVVEPAAGGTPAKVKRARSYTLTPGAAHVYHEGDVHSPRREGPTRLIRIEGTNMERVQRRPYEAV